MQEDEQTLSVNALRQYLDLLSHSFATENLPAWSPSLRSRTANRTSPTRHFTDPSIAAAVLRLTPERLLRDPETFGLLFESLCIRDLCIYAGKLGGRIFHYRDRSGLEADAVVSLDDGRWAPVEVKLGGAQIDEAAKSLRRLTERVEDLLSGRTGIPHGADRHGDGVSPRRRRELGSCCVSSGVWERPGPQRVRAFVCGGGRI